MVTIVKVRLVLESLDSNVRVHSRKEGLVFSHGINQRGKPFDFAILQEKKGGKPLVRLTRFRYRTRPRQPISNTSEAVRAIIENDSDLNAIRCLADYSLKLSTWIEVGTKDPVRLAKSFGLALGFEPGPLLPRRTAISFDLRDLSLAADIYSFHDKGTHGVWPTLVWGRRKQNPATRLDDLVDFLGKWKALRFKGGSAKFRKIYTDWVTENLDPLDRLRGKILYELVRTDFQDILRLSSSFRDNGAPPTTFGKALHFLLPETVMLWDQEIVRNTYKLRSDPESFVSYQLFGCKLLHHVSSDQGRGALEKIENDHAKSAGYFEPMTIILDHLAYSAELSARAVSALGGPRQAFSDS